MCGISGFIDYSKSSTQDDLVRMTDALEHRGPDDSGYNIYQNGSATVGLGQRRLSIIDLTVGGHQPMSNVDGTVNIVFNGEIYNYAEIKNTLISLGHVFNTNSDTEVILHSYEQWGINCLQQFIGMFAIVIYDAKTQKVLFIRDRAGVKPLYMHQSKNLVLFASELKSFHQHPRFEKNICNTALTNYFTKGYISAPLTIFQNTFQVKAGNYVEIDLTSQKVENVCYWNVLDYYAKPKVTDDYNTAVENVQSIISSACKYRMVSDVPVGVFLSGGYDSTLVTAILSQQASSPLNTFTIGFAEEQYDEAKFAKSVAQHLGTSHNEYYCTQAEALDIVQDLGRIYDEPFADNSAIPTILVSKIAKKSVTVALSADGGDEIFAGYRSYQHAQKLHNVLKLIPSVAQRTIKQMASLSSMATWPGLSAYSTSINRLLSVLPARAIADIHNRVEFIFSKEELNDLLVPQTIDSGSAPTNNFLESLTLLPLDQMLSKDFQSYMVDDILTKVDRATMSVALEGREPLLDHRIIEYVAQLPVEYKANGAESKRIIRSIVHKFVPPHIMDRKKMGFTMPVHKWMHTDLRSLLDDCIAHDTSAYINQSYVESIVKKYLANPEDRHTFQKVWLVFNFKLWFKQWM
ncbi:MAG: hypothetical protein RL660_604 [Bacteroidota bacterium]|jgi:asparagine synthase (glutamine-hydrolysing)